MFNEAKKLGEHKRSRVERSLSRFLLFTVGILCIYVPLNASQGAMVLAGIQSAVLLILPLLYWWLKKGGSQLAVKHGIGLCALVIFVALLFNPSIENTGIYWIFGYPLIVFFFLGVRTGLQWVVTYFIAILIGVALAYMGYVHLYFSYAQVMVAMLELFFFSVLGYFFVVDNAQAEQEMESHLNYLQVIDNIEQIVHNNVDMDDSIERVLQVILQDFKASRAWLLCPCDVDAEHWSVPYECTVDAFPGALDAGVKYPMNADVRQIFTTALQHEKPVCYSSRQSMPDTQGMLKAFGIQAQMMMVIRPEAGEAWLLGMHQCDRERSYSASEQRLFHDVARRIEDALKQKLLYRDLKAASQKAEAANHAKSEFLSVMSHELRTPLHGIIGLQSLIAMDKADLRQEHQEHLQLAQQAAKSLEELVNDILHLSKVESGALELAQQRFALKSCLMDSVTPFIIACREKGLVLHIQLQDVPEYVVGDAVHLRQVLVNLIGNAVKFTNSGQVKVLVHVSAGKLYFEVSDTGIGMDKAWLPRIFEPFLQATALADGQQRGTGLGTTIAKRFVELMGGEITVSSVLGQGSSFCFWMPCVAEDTDARLCWQQDVSQVGFHVHGDDVAVAFDAADMKKLHVLLAEDDPIAQRVAEKRFKRAGIALDIAKDGEQAWQMVQGKRYDMLLTDIRMPKLDGTGLASRIRQWELSENLPALPIIGLSAHALDEVVQHCADIGMNAFMVKPVDPDTVLGMMQKMLAEGVGAS